MLKGPLGNGNNQIYISYLMLFSKQYTFPNSLEGAILPQFEQIYFQPIFLDIVTIDS